MGNDITLAGVALVGTGGPAPCRAALPDRRVSFCFIGIGFHIRLLPFYDGKDSTN